MVARYISIEAEVAEVQHPRAMEGRDWTDWRPMTGNTRQLGLRQGAAVNLLLNQVRRRA